MKLFVTDRGASGTRDGFQQVYPGQNNCLFTAFWSNARLICEQAPGDADFYTVISFRKSRGRWPVFLTEDYSFAAAPTDPTRN
jgi:hypothetical protein